MKDVLLAFAEHLNSSVFVLLAILVAAGLALYKIGALKEKFMQHDKGLGKLDTMNDKIIELATKVQLIYDNTNPRKLVAAHSPLALTDLGKDLSKRIDAEKIFSRLLPSLLADMNRKCANGTNAYDIQVAALDIAKNSLPTLLNAEEINKVKDVAFNLGILIEDVWTIFGIYLRDYVLNERSIPVMDVDKHDPERQSC